MMKAVFFLFIVSLSISVCTV